MVSWFLSLSFKYQILFAFLAGMMLDGIIITFVLYFKNKKILAYQRQLEKQAINSTENSSRVKVLEQKIEVLEKALENALNKG